MDSMSSDRAREYFDFLTDLGMTKHYGSMDATRELVELCRISDDQIVLDVGCGVGATPCFLVKTIGCRVIGVDLLEKMLEQSQARASKEDVEDGVEFTTADARKLPFKDNYFDAVILESVNVFFENKLETMHEYIRVTSSEGFVGLTEMT